MRLKRVRVTKFRSIDDSGWVELGDTTCLVGKNEAGKTAFLQALAHLRPVDGQPGNYDAVIDYPSKDYGPYRRREDTDPDVVAEAEYELSGEEVEGLEEAFGQGVLKNNRVGYRKNYKNEAVWTFGTNEAVVVKHLVAQAGLSGAAQAQAEGAATVAELAALLGELPEPMGSSTEVATVIQAWPSQNFRQKMLSCFDSWAPRFFFFDDYSIMPGRVSIQDLRLKVSTNTLDDAERAFLSFLTVGGATLDEFEDELNFERLTRQLEATANSIGSQVFKYWTQNKSLRVNVQMSQANPNDEPPLNQGTILNVRIFNERHGVTVAFDERSRGFVWFFSFFAYFSALDADPGSLVLLLDEPGLNLHAKAQGDFLRFIEERLAQSFRVIYTTHSPFLIDPAHLERVRTVEDVDEKGTVISADVLSSDSDTVFPMQGALGYDLAQTLFLGPDCLLVEGPSDLIYIQVVGEAVLAAGGEALDPRWVVTPVGGADKLATFVSLIGANQLNVAVLLDVGQRHQQRIRDLQASGHLRNNAIVEVSQFVGKKDADIEDIFEPGFYLKLVNGAYAGELTKPLTNNDLTDKNPRIVHRLEKYFEASKLSAFNHYRPAVHLLREQATLLSEIDAATVERAKAMFAAVNALLS